MKPETPGGNIKKIESDVDKSVIFSLKLLS
jgi:hypothetical protein